MRSTARLGSLLSAVVLGTMLVAPPSYAAKSLSVSCTPGDGLVSYPSGTAAIALVVTFDGDQRLEDSIAVSPRRAGTATALNTTSLALVRIDATALSQTGKVLASGSATC